MPPVENAEVGKPERDPLAGDVTTDHVSVDPVTGSDMESSEVISVDTEFSQTLVVWDEPCTNVGCAKTFSLLNANSSVTRIALKAKNLF